MHGLCLFNYFATVFSDFRNVSHNLTAILKKDGNRDLFSNEDHSVLEQQTGVVELLFSMNNNEAQAQIGDWLKLSQNLLQVFRANSFIRNFFSTHCDFNQLQNTANASSLQLSTHENELSADEDFATDFATMVDMMSIHFPNEEKLQQMRARRLHQGETENAKSKKKSFNELIQSDEIAKLGWNGDGEVQADSAQTESDEDGNVGVDNREDQSGTLSRAPRIVPQGSRVHTNAQWKKRKRNNDEDQETADPVQWQTSNLFPRQLFPALTSEKCLN